MLTESIKKTPSDANSAQTTKKRFMENNPRLATLNKAYYFGEYDLSEYRHLRNRLIDEITKKDEQRPDQTQRFNPIQQNHTIKIDPKAAQPVSVKSIIPPSEDLDSHRGPSVLQFLWVSVAVILFIYMYTATID